MCSSRSPNDPTRHTGVPSTSTCPTAAGQTREKVCTPVNGALSTMASTALSRSRHTAASQMLKSSRDHDMPTTILERHPSESTIDVCHPASETRLMCCNLPA